MWRQGSQVSMREARGSASLLSSHGRGIGPHTEINRYLLVLLLWRDAEIGYTYIKIFFV